MANVPRIFDCWQAPDRDAVKTINDNLPRLLDEKVSMLTKMEGLDGHDEAAVQEQNGQELRRPRRWHKALERMGVMFREGRQTRLTDLGRLLRVADERETRDAEAIKAAAIAVLKKFQLKNPADETGTDRYPDDCDIHPYWAMWVAASELEWRLHWDELNRELMRVVRVQDLPAAIERIRAARAEPGYDPVSGGSENVPLSPRCHDEPDPPEGRDADGQVRDHYATPWFRRAGFGEVFFKSRRDGYYEVPEDVRELISRNLQPTPEFVEFEDPRAWMEYYGSLPDTVLQRPLRAEWQAPRPDFGPLVGLENSYDVAAAALRAGKHVVLFGPPGSGKSELALLLCAGHGVGAYMTTATADWTTFDVIGGYLPDPRLSEPGAGGEPLNFFPGALLRSIQRREWLVIDELNRADIDKAFGELFTVLAGHAVRLPYVLRDGGYVRNVVIGPSVDENDQAFEIPTDWRSIGTMNTFDKASLYQLSFAFMRRFAFVPVDLPSEQHFTAIIRAELGRQAQGNPLDEFAVRMEELASALFSSDEAALGAIELRVGPAIVLDVLRHAAWRASSIGRTRESARSTFLEALPVYLLPQFEGRHREHAAIIQVLQEAIGLSDAEVAELDQRLRPWTGFEPARE